VWTELGRLSGRLSVAESRPDLKARSSQYDRRVNYAGSAVLQRQIASEAAPPARHDKNRRFFDRRRSGYRPVVVHAEMIGRILGAATREIPQPGPEDTRKGLWVGDPSGDLPSPVGGRIAFQMLKHPT